MEQAKLELHQEQIKKFKETINAASKRKGEVPKDRPTKEALRQNFMNQPMDDTKAISGRSGHTIHTTFIPSAYLPCTKSLSELEKTRVKELQLETHHRGKYLLLKCTTRPRRLPAIMAIVEDEDEEGLLLQLYGQEEESVRPAFEILNEGKVIVVKEPYFKVTGDGGYGLRVDHVTDIRWLNASDDIFPAKWRPPFLTKSALEWKEEGDEAVKRKNWWQAIECYTEALKSPSTINSAAINETIKRNRSLAFLKTEQFDAALNDLSYSSVQLVETNNEKTLFRLAQALYGLERFRDCSKVILTLLKEYPVNKDAPSFLTRVIFRISEGESAKYDFKAMYWGAGTVFPPILDHATFKGSVQVRVSPLAGRGLFTTAAVKAGDMLLCEKAFAISYADTAKGTAKAGSASLSVLIHPEANCIKKDTSESLITTAVHKLAKNPSLIPAFTDLNHGEYQSITSVKVDGDAVIDTFLVVRIVLHNSFEGGTTARETHLASLTQETPAENDVEGSGIWILASYINHSCLYNCRRSFIGDMQIVRATQDMPADSELVFPYIYPKWEDHDYGAFQKGLQHWGFTCSCLFCLEANNLDKKIREKRQGLRKDFENLFRNATRNIDVTKLDMGRIESLLAQLEKTTSKGASKEVPRFELWDLYWALARAYAVRGTVDKVLWATMKSLETLGFEIDDGDSSIVVQKWGMVVDDVVGCWLLLWTAFVVMRESKKAHDTKNLAITSYKIVVGEDETFEETYWKKAAFCAAKGMLWRGL